jgi:hypothetical protein
MLLNNTVWLFRGSFVDVVNVDGKRSTGRWPCIETGTLVDGKGYDNRAIYEDRYVNQNGRWLFQHRGYVYLWLSTERLPVAPALSGKKIAADLSMAQIEK